VCQCAKARWTDHPGPATGKTPDLHSTLESPGVAHNTREEWEGFVIDLVERRYVDGKPVTRFEIRRR
jgi:hypothetical protein